MEVHAQALYDVAVRGIKVHRGMLRDATQSLIEGRLYEPLEKTTLQYETEDGKEFVVPAGNKDINTMRMKILALFVHCQRYDYSRSSREMLKMKLGLADVNCSNFMPEIIDGRTREWTVDNLEDAITALMK